VPHDAEYRVAGPSRTAVAGLRGDPAQLGVTDDGVYPAVLGSSRDGPGPVAT